MPTWQIEKSKRTGSSGSSARSDAGDIGGHPPARAGVAREPQAVTEADDVRVERHDQLAPAIARPHAEIDLVTAHHPAQVKIQPLARATGGRPREEVAHAGALRHASVDASHVERQGASAKSCRARHRRQRRPRSSPSRRTARPIPIASSICRRIHSSAARSTPRVQRCTIARSSGCGASGSNAHERRRMRCHDPNSVAIEFRHARDPAERQRRGAEPGDSRSSRRANGRTRCTDRRPVFAVVGVIEQSRRKDRGFKSESVRLHALPSLTGQKIVIGSPAAHIGQSDAEIVLRGVIFHERVVGNVARRRRLR